MEWNTGENFTMKLKIFSMEWNAKKLPVWNMVFHSQGRIQEGGHYAMAFHFGSAVMHEYLRIVCKIEPWSPLEFGQKKNELNLSDLFFRSSPKSGKNGLNLNEDFFFLVFT